MRLANGRQRLIATRVTTSGPGMPFARHSGMRPTPQPCRIWKCCSCSPEGRDVEAKARADFWIARLQRDAKYDHSEADHSAAQHGG